MGNPGAVITRVVNQSPYPITLGFTDSQGNSHTVDVLRPGDSTDEFRDMAVEGVWWASPTEVGEGPRPDFIDIDIHFEE